MELPGIIYKKVCPWVICCIFFFADNIYNIQELLHKCHTAADTVYQMEKKLYDDKIITIETSGDGCHVSNKSLLQLETTLLDMCSINDLCQGVLYTFPVRLDGRYILR